MVAVVRALSSDLHTFEIAFFRGLFGALFLLPWLARAGIKTLATQRIGTHLARSLVGLAAVYLLFGALAVMPLGDVAAITFTRPILASLAVILILGEISRGRRWSATAVGLLGAVAIIRPGFQDVSLGMWLAIGAVLTMAAVSVLAKSLTRTEPPDVIVMYQSIFYTPIAIVPALFVWITPSLENFVLLLAMGGLGTLTQRSLNRAYASADASAVLPFEFTRLPLSAFIGLLLFAEFPDLWTWIGGTIIFAGTLFLAHREVRADRRAAGNESIGA